MSASVDITRTRGTSTATLTGWVAPAFTTAVGEQSARAYLEDVTRDDLRTDDMLAADGLTYIVTKVGWWPPDSIEATLAGVDLPDTCLIERETGASLDEVTNVVTSTWSTVWSGPCNIQIGAGVTPLVVDNAGETMVAMRGMAQIPASAVDVQPGDRLTVATSRDARLVGVHLAITGVQMDTTPVLRVLNISDAR